MASHRLLPTLTILVLVLTSVKGMCMPEHPQTAVCRAQFVIKARIVEEDHPIANHNNCSGKTSSRASKTSSYPAPLKEKTETAEDDAFFKPKQIRVVLLKKFKGFSNRSISDVITIDAGSPWGPKVKTGHTYLLTGYISEGKALMTMCNWYSLWKDLTYVQRVALRRYYLKSCHCTVEFCPDGGCPMKPNHCAWTPHMEEIGDTKLDCQSKFGICLWGGKRCILYSPKFVYSCNRGPSMP